MSPETKAFNLHVALSRLLERYNELLKDTDSEPLFGEDEGSAAAAKALFENRPDAAWEPPAIST